MTYDDIIDWAEEFVPSERFEEFSDWERSVRENFKRHKHFFPEGMTSTLAEYWEEKYDTLADLTEEDLEDIESDRRRAQRERDIEKFRERAVSAPREIVRREKISRSLLATARERRREKRAQKMQRFQKKMSKAERKRKRGIGR